MQNANETVQALRCMASADECHGKMCDASCQYWQSKYLPVEEHFDDVCSDAAALIEQQQADLAGWEASCDVRDRMLCDKEKELAELREAGRNDPLTLDELRQMSGEPVWILDSVCNEIECLRFDKTIPTGTMRGNDFRFEQFGTDVGIIRWECKYGVNWVAYRFKPAAPEQKGE